MFVNARLKGILYTQYLREFCCSRRRLCPYFLEPLLSESGNRLWSSCGWLIFRQIGADGGVSFLNRAQRVLIETQPQLEISQTSNYTLQSPFSRFRLASKTGLFFPLRFSRKQSEMRREHEGRAQ